MSFHLATSRETDVGGKAPAPSTPAHVGPGLYDLSASPRSQVRIPHEPFSSSTLRSDPVGKESAATPGPGAYNTAAAPSAPASFNGIVRNSFITKSDRFRASASTASPGPGAYEALSSLRVAKPRGRASPRRSGSASSSPAVAMVMQRQKVCSVPSIPTASQSFGYEFDEHNRLAANSTSSPYKYSGRGADGPSAGDYNPGVHPKKGNGNAAAFSASGTRRFRRGDQRACAAASYDVPGAFDQLSGAKAKAKLSSSFASRVVRVATAVGGQKPSVTGLVDATSGNDVPVSTSSATAVTPGPGAFNLPGAFDHLRVREGAAPRQQFFGTSATRFGESDTFLQMRTPGPGSYRPMPGLAAQVARRQPRRGHRVAHVQGQRRRQQPRRAAEPESDGRSYEIDAATGMAGQLKKRLASRNRGKGFGFGSSAAQRVLGAAGGRGGGATGGAAVGVGGGRALLGDASAERGRALSVQHAAPAAAAANSGRSSSTIGRGSSFPRKKVGAFLSKAPRFRFGDDAPPVALAPGPGAYNVATKLGRRGPHVSLKGQYDSHASRFSGAGAGGKAGAMPGPGQYNPSAGTFSTSVKKDATISKGLRFRGPGSGAPSGGDAPGPGHYDVEFTYGNLNQPTFNMKIASEAGLF